MRNLFSSVIGIGLLVQAGMGFAADRPCVPSFGKLCPPRIEIAAAELKPAFAGAGHAADLKVTVRNSGVGAAAPFDVVVSYRGRPLQHLKWPGLGVGVQDTRIARLSLPPAGGPICVHVSLANVVGTASKQACLTQAGVPVQRSVVPQIPALSMHGTGKPVSGKKPGTKPGRYAQVSTLRVNGHAVPITVGLRGSATVSWNLSSVPDASGVHLLVRTSSLDAVDCTAPPATPLPDSGKYTTSPRALTLGNAYYRSGLQYYIKACLFNRTRDQSGRVTDSYTGVGTNQVVLYLDSRLDPGGGVFDRLGGFISDVGKVGVDAMTVGGEIRDAIRDAIVDAAGDAVDFLTSPFSNDDPVWPGNIPTGTRAWYDTPASIRVTWNDNATGEDRYYVNVNRDNRGWVSYVLSANLTSFVMSGADPKSNYCIDIKAFKHGKGWTNPSRPIVCVAGWPNPWTGQPPAIWFAQSIGGNQIKIGWRDNTRDESGFVLYILSATGNERLQFPANTTEHILSGAVAKQTYCFFVQAYNRYPHNPSYSTLPSNTMCVRHSSEDPRNRANTPGDNVPPGGSRN